MIESIEELRAVLSGTQLADTRIALASVDGTQQTIFALEVQGPALDAWALMRGLLARTGRWPVLTQVDACVSDSWDVRIRRADVSSRFYFDEEEKDARESDRPEAIIAASRGLDVAQEMARIKDDDSVDLDEYLELAIADTGLHFGTAPEIEDADAFLRQHGLKTCEQIERWLFDWEQTHVGESLALPKDGLRHLRWYQPAPEALALLLMPTANGWEVPAYINWYGSLRRNSQFIIALLRAWHDRNGAELVAHFGTILQFNVATRPKNAEEALELAWQQYLIAPCTTILPGVSPRNHARALMHTDRWYLHERP